MSEKDHDNKTNPPAILDLDGEHIAPESETFSKNTFIYNGVAIEPTELYKAIECCQAGDAFLYTKLFRNTFRYDHTARSWFVFDGHSWRKDIFSESLKNLSVLSHVYKKESLRQYQRAQEVKKEQATSNTPMTHALNLANKRYTEFLLRHSEINGLSYRKEVLRLAVCGQNSLGTQADSWDRHPSLLSCGNGIFDFSDFSLRNGSPSDLIRTSTDTPFSGITEPAKTWGGFVLSLLGNDSAQAITLQHLLGQCIAGCRSDIPVIFVNGSFSSSTNLFIKMLKLVLGDHMDSTGLFPRPSRLSIVPSTKGRRLVWDHALFERGSMASSILIDYVIHLQNSSARSAFQPGMLIVSDSDMLRETIGNQVGGNLWTFSFSHCEDLMKDSGLEDALVRERSGILSWMLRGSQLFLGTEKGQKAQQTEIDFSA